MRGGGADNGGSDPNGGNGLFGARHAAPQPASIVRFRLDLEYAGEGFSGWQRQANAISVQGVLEDALARLCGHPVSVIGSGRTDAGVHALGQVAHFDTSNPRPEGVVRRALNASTPQTVSIRQVRQVSLKFHARRSARRRCYRYRIVDGSTRPALELNRVWHAPGPLDEERMVQAGRLLLGRHDFSAFRAAACQAKSPVRTLTQVEVVRQGEELQVMVGGNAFLHHMVRNIVGSLVLVGRRRWEVERFAAVLAGRDRRLAGPTAPAHGLYLMQVLY